MTRVIVAFEPTFCIVRTEETKLPKSMSFSVNLKGSFSRTKRHRLYLSKSDAVLHFCTTDLSMFLEICF